MKIKRTKHWLKMILWFAFNGCHSNEIFHLTDVTVLCLYHGIWKCKLKTFDGIFLSYLLWSILSTSLCSEVQQDTCAKLNFGTQTQLNIARAMAPLRTGDGPLNLTRVNCGYVRAASCASIAICIITTAATHSFDFASNKRSNHRDQHVRADSIYSSARRRHRREGSSWALVVDSPRFWYARSNSMSKRCHAVADPTQCSLLISVRTSGSRLSQLDGAC